MSMGRPQMMRRARKAAEKAARPFLGRWIVVFYDEADPDGTPVMEANNPRDLAMEAGIGEAAARSMMTRLMPGSNAHLSTAKVLGRRCAAYFVSMTDGDVLCSKEGSGDD